MRVADLAALSDVDRLFAALFGSPLGESAPRVLHVTSAWRRGGELVTIRIGPHAPASEHDFFALNLARARADAVLTTGRILRAEPTMHHGLQGPGRSAELLAGWRRQRLGKASPPTSLVLTSGRDLDLDHVLFRGAARAVVYTSPAGAARLAGPAGERGIEVVGEEGADVRGALCLLRDRYAAATVSVEAGPSTARRLYAPPLAVDELMLSVYEAADLDVRARGEVFLGLDELAAVLRPLPRTRARPVEGWSFWRYVAAAS